jgi:prepilin-type processing-associated H-X9-DG protein
MQNGQTTTNPGKARGWIEWPMWLDGANGGGDNANQAPITMPLSGFDHIIRCSYWINAYNPIGTPGTLPVLTATDVYYTASIGWGPAAGGLYTSLHRTSKIRHSSRLITVADGVYMGRQGSTQLTNPSLVPQNQCRIGYRHRGNHGPNTSCNAAFADGHVESIDCFSFPQSKSANNPNAAAQNLGGPTVYANPEGIFQ